MSISISTDVHCDTCGLWLHYRVSDQSKIADAKAAAARGGWSASKYRHQTICPACNGSRPDYWEGLNGAVCGEQLR